MLAAILLIGFTISTINERNIVQEKTRNGKRMIQDFQTIMDFISKDKKDFKYAIPFGPFLSLGAVISLFYGENLIRWYLYLNR